MGSATSTPEAGSGAGAGGGDASSSGGGAVAPVSTGAWFVTRSTLHRYDAATRAMTEVSVPDLPQAIPHGGSEPVDIVNERRAVVGGQYLWAVGGEYNVFIKGVRPSAKTWVLDLGDEASGAREWAPGPDLTTVPDYWPHMNTCRLAVVGTSLHVLGDWGAHEVIDTVARTGAKLDPVPSPRKDPGVVVTGSRIVVVGGDSGPKYVPTVEVFDTVSSSWAELPPMVNKRTDCNVVVCLAENDGSSSRIVVAGGHPSATKAESYDPASGSGGAGAWTEVADVPHAIWKEYFGFDGAYAGMPGCVLVIATLDGVGRAVLVYNVADNAWTQLAKHAILDAPLLSVHGVYPLATPSS